MFARTKGFALAMATLLVSSIGLALSFDRSPFECGGSCAEPEPSFSLFETLFSMGFIPCALAASRSARSQVRWRTFHRCGAGSRSHSSRGSSSP